MNLDMRVDGELGVIRVLGELDGTDAPRLHETADLMLSDGVRDLVIDCDGITFIDSCGLQVIVSAHTRAEAEGGTLTLRRPSALALQLFELTGLDAMLRIDRASASDRTSERRETAPAGAGAVPRWRDGAPAPFARRPSSKG